MSTPSQEKLKCPIKINGEMGSDQTVVPRSSGSRSTMGRMEGENRAADHASNLSEENKRKVVSYWAQVSFLKQTGMSGHKARSIAYQRVFGKGDAT